MAKTLLHAECYLLRVPLVKREVAEECATAIVRCGELVRRIGELQPTGRLRARAHAELNQVTGRFDRINQTLEKAVKAGHLTAAQERSLARNFEAIARALEKGAGSTR
jgi:hypothetical protein